MLGLGQGLELAVAVLVAAGIGDFLTTEGGDKLTTETGDLLILE